MPGNQPAGVPVGRGKCAPIAESSVRLAANKVNENSKLE